jgi:hypothetical protein
MATRNSYYCHQIYFRSPFETVLCLGCGRLLLKKFNNYINKKQKQKTNKQTNQPTKQTLKQNPYEISPMIPTTSSLVQSSRPTNRE